MSNHSVKTEVTPEYVVSPPLYDDDDLIIQRAKSILLSRIRKPGAAVSSSGTVKDFLILNMALLAHEEFHCMWLDSQYRVIEVQPMFAGTLTQTSVYPREVVKAALAINAGAVILVHNHPSGLLDPSPADINLTAQLKKALSLVDVRVLDHMIVAGDSILSMAERGYV